MPRRVLTSPIGPLLLVEENGALAELRIGEAPNGPVDCGDDGSPLLAEAARQLAAYFAGSLRDFDLPLAPAASPFQARMRAAMLAIPFGETRTYGELARDLGDNTDPRAIGQGCGANPLPILVPCHRVVAAGGKLGGYSGGSGRTTKRWLLGHEAPDLFRTSLPEPDLRQGP